MQLYDEIFHWVYLSSYPPIINKIACCQRLLKWDLAQQVPDEKANKAKGLRQHAPWARTPQARRRREAAKTFAQQLFCSKGRTDKNPLLWRGTIFAIQFSVPPSTRYKRVSSSMSENYLSTRRTAKKDGKSIINRVTFVADKIGKVRNWY